MTLIKDDPIGLISLFSGDNTTSIVADVGGGEHIVMPYQFGGVIENKKNALPEWISDAGTLGRFTLAEGFYFVAASVISKQVEAVYDEVFMYLTGQAAGPGVIVETHVADGVHSGVANAVLTLNVSGVIQVITPTDYEVRVSSISPGSLPVLGGLNMPVLNSGNLTINRMNFNFG